MGMVQASLQKRLDRHFLACAAAAVTVGMAEEGWAVVQYSGLQNIASDTTTAFGTYINFETGAVQNGVGGAAGFDINVFSWRQDYPADSGVFYPFVATYTGGGANNKVMATGTQQYKLTKVASGAPIGAAGPFTTKNFAFAVYGNPNVYPVPTDWAPQPVTGFIGVKFQTSTDVGTNVHFGWVRITIGAPTGPTGPNTSRYPLTIVDWAWETTANTAIAAGAGIPEPTSAAALGLLAIGSLGSRAWRKKSA